MKGLVVFLLLCILHSSSAEESRRNFAEMRRSRKEFHRKAAGIAEPHVNGRDRLKARKPTQNSILPEGAVKTEEIIKEDKIQAKLSKDNVKVEEEAPKDEKVIRKESESSSALHALRTIASSLTKPLAMAVDPSSNDTIAYSGYFVHNEYAADSCTGTPSQVYYPFNTCIPDTGYSLFISYYNYTSSSLHISMFNGQNCSEPKLVMRGMSPVDEEYCFSSGGSTESSSSYRNFNSFKMSYASDLPTTFDQGIISRNYSESYQCQNRNSNAVTSVAFRPSNTCLWKTEYDMYLGEYSARAYMIVSCTDYYYYGYVNHRTLDFGKDLSCTNYNYDYYSNDYNCEQLNSYDNYSPYNVFAYRSSSCSNGDFYNYPSFPNSAPTMAPTTAASTFPSGELVQGYYAYHYFNGNYQVSPTPCKGQTNSVDFYKVGSCRYYPNSHYSEMTVLKYLPNSANFELHYYEWNGKSCTGPITYHSMDGPYNPNVCAGNEMYYHVKDLSEAGDGYFWNEYTSSNSECDRTLAYEAYFTPAFNCENNENYLICKEYPDKGVVKYTQSYYGNDQCEGDVFSHAAYSDDLCYSYYNGFEGAACSGGGYDLVPNKNPTFPSPYTKDDTFYVGSFGTQYGYYYWGNPATMTCQEGCAMYFGGDSTDYIGSISANKITRSCYASMRYVDIVTVPHNYKLCDYFNERGCISTYVSDYRPAQYNHCFKHMNRDDRKFQTDIECEYFSTDNTNYAYNTVKTCKVYACGGDQITISGGCDALEGAGPYCVGDTYFRLYNMNNNQVAESDDECNACAGMVYKAEGDCQTYTLRQGCFEETQCSGVTSIKVKAAGTVTKKKPSKPAKKPSKKTKSNAPIGGYGTLKASSIGK